MDKLSPSVSLSMASSTVMSLVLLLVLLLSQNAAHCSAYNMKPMKSEESCDIYQGKWVYDASYPLYEPSKCPFILNQFDCKANGRPDSLYLKLKWQPHACNLPMLDGRKLLRRFRGKQIMFVGDSISLNQWQSLTCLLHTAVPRAVYTITRIGDLSIFKFLGYNVSVTFSRNAFLVDIVRDSKNRRRVLKLDSITSGDAWKAADVLIFNSWHWWLHTGHEQPGTDWAKPKESCLGQKWPFIGPRYPGGPHPAQVVLERTLKRVSGKVELLDVTGMSQLRKDGHPSVYGTAGRSFSDCSHWCLGGLPDTWNLLLYASLFKNTY